jgi:uncharacterized damage-inducible protein DinB
MSVETTTRLREALERLLTWEEAHVGFDTAVAGLAPQRRGSRPPGFEHSPWQLLEHLRIAQKDILDFCASPNYVHELSWPSDYWPSQPAPPSPRAWDDSIAEVRVDLDRFKRLIADPATDLFALVPTGKGQQTYLRAVLLVADHTAYHVGQLVALRKALGSWPPG